MASHRFFGYSLSTLFVAGTASLLAIVMCGWLLNESAYAKDLADLKILFVGSERTTEFLDFLKDKVAHVAATKRADFRVSDASPYDVVLLDWPQVGGPLETRKVASPLGERTLWNKPTVLLGSAGLNLAMAWKVKGGSGCTCLDPLAYGLRDHEMFSRPFEIDRSKMVRIPTPPDFRKEITESEILVLPLVDDIDRNRAAGWCTYANDFANYPDVEFFCGGVNQKTPTAAAMWRQGNLFHFGFEQSPSDMNAIGQKLLLNAIAYVSRFNEDRPIAITPSVFTGPVAISRGVILRYFQKPENPLNRIKHVLSGGVTEQLLNAADRDRGMLQWAEQNARFLHPNGAELLEIDEDLVALGSPFDQPEFFERSFAAMTSDDEDALALARRLLERYIPDGPKSGDVAQWKAWWSENRPYAFASDAGDYRWYIDPLAKQRRVPVSELRGPKRADVTTAVSTASQ